MEQLSQVGVEKCGRVRTRGPPSAIYTKEPNPGEHESSFIWTSGSQPGASWQFKGYLVITIRVYMSQSQECC